MADEWLRTAKAEQDAAQSSNPGTSGAGSRFASVLPLAGVVTVGLTLSMAALISTEFRPQDKSETADFEINPVEDIVEISPIVRTPLPYERVETPPPPPQLDIKTAEAVEVPIIKEAGAIPEMDMPVIDIGRSFKIQPSDREPQPLVRIPPVFPTRFLQGSHSGYCQMRFDVSPDGHPYNVEAANCTDRSLSAASKKSVLKWRYQPKIYDGVAVAREGLTTKIRFDLSDERGNRLPLPQGY